MAHTRTCRRIGHRSSRRAFVAGSAALAAAPLIAPRAFGQGATPAAAPGGGASPAAGQTAGRPTYNHVGRHNRSLGTRCSRVPPSSASCRRACSSECESD